MFRRLLKSARRGEPVASIAAGQRVYAIGDVHGRLDLFDALLAQIEADHAAREPAVLRLILLGDLVDRGPDSAGVIERAFGLWRGDGDVRMLLGNHEEVFARVLAGDEKALRFFCRIGGRETILSYGIAEGDYLAMDYPELMAAFQSRVPEHHRDFLTRFEDIIEIDDYVFVHAGIRPGVALSDQTHADLRWIRDIFLEHNAPFERIVVHGHTITEQIDVRANRIGIDTGAYAGGPLTAVALHEGKRWFLQAA